MLVGGRRAVPMRPRRAHLGGFTLIELMTTISVLTILSALALPSFRDFVTKQRVRNASFQLVAALTQARSQAITQNGAVNVQKSGSAWNFGWTVTDGTTTFGDQESLKNLNISDTGGLSTISYGPDGRLTTASTKFTIQPTDAPSAATTRCITIGLSGMPTSMQGACS